MRLDFSFVMHTQFLRDAYAFRQVSRLRKRFTAKVASMNYASELTYIISPS